jgi:uncharacterized membrane protein
MVLNLANISSEVKTFSEEITSPKEVKAGMSFSISVAFFCCCIVFTRGKNQAYHCTKF